MTLAGFGGLIPNIYAWRPPKSLEDPDEGKFGWSICECKPGKDLDAEFPSLAAEDQENVIIHLADIYSALQKAAIPSTADKLGGLTFDRHGTMLIKRVEKYLRDCGVARALHGVDTTQRCLIHSDFTMNNLLFDKESKKITALLDFDFASINHPVEKHYFASFSDVGGGLHSLSPAMYSCVFSDNFEQQPSELSNKEMKNWNTAKLWNAATAERNILRPKTIPGVEKIEALRRFEKSLSKMRQVKATFLEKYPENAERTNETVPVVIVGQMLDAHDQLHFQTQGLVRNVCSKIYSIFD